MTRRLPVLLVAAVLVAAGGTAVRAQTDPPPSTDPTTTTTTGAPSTTTTSPITVVEPPKSTTTTRPVAPTTTTTAPPPSEPPFGGSGGDEPPPPGTPTTVPPDAQRLINSVVRSRANSTYALIDALRPLQDEGLTATEAALVGFGAFPVAGPTTFVHDWLFPRYVPTFHLHQGTDLFAPTGTPVRAPFDGTLRRTDGAVGGLAAYVTAADGTYAYMAHLVAAFPGQTDGMTVRQGDVVGFVGSSGDAAGGPAHVHFELHPRGGAAMDPKATLDAWLADAQTRVPALVAQVRARRSAINDPGASVTPVVPVAPEVPALTEPANDFTGPAVAWAIAANPSAGTLDIAADLVAGALGTVDWPDRPDPVETTTAEARG